MVRALEYCEWPQWFYFSFPLWSRRERDEIEKEKRKQFQTANVQLYTRNAQAIRLTTRHAAR
jgi:hypothetical protein